ncbi:glycoside hydrolase family 9 protein [Streptomyces sp. H10-C2]|uniref:glycoside hydrolase family 9 protein n=1 Tax=unclassified Streptomyces TaxID=2593676 RepID=UPI0024BB3D44|nr:MULTISPECIES: glycoside hydrolase family 9 protein [unclassified Streptomyces]MDJ0344655.1 glycoside hydrolase family 9 protein [Streptomyces sp. PH10-H1]MDJ0373185.1 glycoside hydrolase family 9 protein [Streptomyces sp. H10-C2]
MPHEHSRRGLGMAAAAVTAAAVVAALLSGGAGTAEAATTGQVRVNQVGYDGSGTKEAFLLAKGAASGATWKLLDSHGATAATGRTGTSRGSWNAAYPAVYLIDFSAVQTSGTYHLVVSGAATGASPSFTIGSAQAVYAKPATDATAFFQAQRDGRNVIPGELNRKPAHLNDAHATVYNWPTFTSSDGDTIAKAPTKAGGTVDAEGGWFDAGDYLKFTETTTYADAALQIAARETGASPTSALGAEAQHGLDWLDKMWDGDTGTLYIQVGLGSGTASGSVVGDHDSWRLPQKDDADTANPFLRDRPVFRAGAPGSRISPNQAGRLAADFALGAQRYAVSDPAKAKGYLTAAAQVYALADTHPGTLVTTVPHAYYPETSWQDDLAFGGAELALAAQKLGDSRADGWLKQSATWAKAYGTTGDTLNMYDTSALAYADLARAIKAAGQPAGLPVSYDTLVGNLKAQIASGQARADKDPFHAGAVYNDFDADSHTLGLATTTRLYRGLTGDTSVDRFAVQQLDWLLGANAWGTSFMVGEGSTYPQCTAGQLGNLAGSLDGKAPLETGAIVNGPNGSSQFNGGLGDYLAGMRKCPAAGDPFGAFTGHGSRYVDDVRSWQSSEPALDMDASGLLAFYLSS